MLPSAIWTYENDGRRIGSTARDGTIALALQRTGRALRDIGIPCLLLLGTIAVIQYSKLGVPCQGGPGVG